MINRQDRCCGCGVRGGCRMCGGRGKADRDESGHKRNDYYSI